MKLISIIRYTNVVPEFPNLESITNVGGDRIFQYFFHGGVLLVSVPFKLTSLYKYITVGSIKQYLGL
jgi:hypothetical protein